MTSTDTRITEIEKVEKGMPATIWLQNDSLPAVVVRVSKKSITLARVATVEGSQRRINDEREPYPCYAEDGDLTQVIGEPQRYAYTVGSDGGRFAQGSISVTVGRALRITDYRY